MKTWIALLTVAGLCPLLAHAADGESLATRNESRWTLYFSVPLATPDHHAKMPVLGLRLDRTALALGSSSTMELVERPVVSLMDLRLSMGRERDVRLDGIPMWTSKEQSKESSDSADGGTPAKPFWRKPTFWIVTGVVATAWILSDVGHGYKKLADGQ